MTLRNILVADSKFYYVSYTKVYIILYETVVMSFGSYSCIEKVYFLIQKKLIITIEKNLLYRILELRCKEEDREIVEFFYNLDVKKKKILF